MTGGFPVSESVAGLTLGELATMLRQKVAAGKWKQTELGTHVQAYLDALAYEEASVHTLDAYRFVLGLFAAENAGRGLEDLEPPDGGLLVREFLSRNWGRSSAATRRQRLAIVRAWLKWLTGEGLIRANAAVNVKAPKERRQDRTPPSFDEIEALVVAQPSLRDQSALMLLAFMGLRKDELRRLQFRHINLKDGTIVIHGKGGHVDKLPLAFERVTAALSLYLLERHPTPEEFLLFPRGHPDRPMDPASVHRWFKLCLFRAGYADRWAPHDLRHAAADAIYKVTGDIVLAQQLLRHSDVRTTRRYVQPGMDRLADGMRRTEEARR